MKAKKKKIIFFSKNLNIGGMEKALVILLNSLNKEKYDITLVLEEKTGDLLQQLDSNITIKEYRLSNNKNILIRKIINFIKRLKWILENYNRYVFSCNYATYSIIGSKLALKASKNNTLYVHNNYYRLFKSDVKKIKDFFKNIEFHKFRTRIFVSNEAMNEVLPIFDKLQKRSLVINNLIDYQQIEKLSEKKININYSKDKVVFTFVGRLEEESKKVSRLIEALVLALKHNPNIELWIIGDGKDKDLYINLMEKKGLDKNIKFFGNQINPYPYIKMSDYIILTSDYEGFPVIYNEALVLNKKIITTILTSDDEINIKDYCFFVEKDVVKISETILKLCNNNNTKQYNLNFEEINKKRLDKIEELINNMEE